MQVDNTVLSILEKIFSFILKEKITIAIILYDNNILNTNQITIFFQIKKYF